MVCNVREGTERGNGFELNLTLKAHPAWVDDRLQPATLGHNASRGMALQMALRRFVRAILPLRRWLARPPNAAAPFLLLGGAEVLYPGQSCLRPGIKKRSEPDLRACERGVQVKEPPLGAARLKRAPEPEIDGGYHGWTHGGRGVIKRGVQAPSSVAVLLLWRRRSSDLSPRERMAPPLAYGAIGERKLPVG
jgi:hypothetical protein